MNAKSPQAGATQPTPQPAPQAPASQKQQPTSGAITLMALRNQIMDMGAAKVINSSTNLLQDSFITTIKNSVEEGDDLAFELFLQIARDKYLPLTGNNITDLQRLQAINKQIDREVDQF
jgi:hypothetical protein